MKKKYENRTDILRRLHQPGAPSVSVLSEETGIPKATLYAWISNEKRSVRSTVQQSGGYAGMAKRTHSRTPSKKLRFVSESMNLEGDQLLVFCQTHGVTVEELLTWRDLALSGIEQSRADGSGMTQSERENQIQQLQAELRRKNDALAEAAALLVLQKKTSDLLGGKR